MHLVHMTHFDVGYTEPSAEGLIDDFTNKWFPAAIQTSEELRKRGGNATFVWTSHTWLLYSYLNTETGMVTQPQLDAPRPGGTRLAARPAGWNPPAEVEQRARRTES